MSDQWAYIDPDTRAMTVANVLPDDVSMWWPVPPDTDPNCIAVGLDGEIIILPAPREYPWQEPDVEGGGWIDTRSFDEREAARMGARAISSLSRIDFLLAAKASGLISEDDAIAASRGEIPPGMSQLIEALTPEQQFEAKVRWGGATTIYRLDPFICDWAARLGVTDGQLDQMFGVTVP